MTRALVTFPCPHCGRPCKNGTGLASHLRKCNRQSSGRSYVSVGLPERVRRDDPITGDRVCFRCFSTHPLGKLFEHLTQECPKSAMRHLLEVAA